MSNTIYPYQFEYESYKYHLTIRDILDIPQGETVSIFFMDRNMFDISCDKIINNLNIPIKPSKFFRHGYYIDFTKKSLNGISGEWKWNWLTTENLYINALDTEYDREFDVDMGGLWYPLKNNHIPEIDEQEICEIPRDFAGKHFLELPESTRLGWRGPMMLRKYMDELPDIIYKYDGYPSENMDDDY